MEAISIIKNSSMYYVLGQFDLREKQTQCQTFLNIVIVK